MMRKHSYVIFLFFIFLSANVFADLEITVKSSDWGEISTHDVKKLCENITHHFEQHLRTENEINDKVNVSRTFRPKSHTTLDPSPDVKYKIGIVLKKNMEIRVDDFYYFIFDFAHEFCHILHNFEVTTINNPNLWFQEGIATMASMWALRSMAETWKRDSPFGLFAEQDGGIAYFYKNFNHYADAYLKVFPEYQYDGTGEEWLSEHEMSLREEYIEKGTFTQYHTAAQLTFKFLPIFEENPEAWNAVRKMPSTKGKMSAYMQDWYDAVDEQDRQYVEAIAEVMGITVKAPVIASIESTEIDADVNNDGYVDLYDCLIVRSGMQNSVSYDTDVNNDGVTNILDLLLVKAIAVEAIIAAAPSKRKVNITTWGAIKDRKKY